MGMNHWWRSELRQRRCLSSLPPFGDATSIERVSIDDEPSPARSNISGKAVRKIITAEPAYAGVLRPVVDLLDGVIQMPLKGENEDRANSVLRGADKKKPRRARKEPALRSGLAMYLLANTKGKISLIAEGVDAFLAF
jgi:hypothetical protein